MRSLKAENFSYIDAMNYMGPQVSVFAGDSVRLGIGIPRFFFNVDKYDGIPERCQVLKPSTLLYHLSFLRLE